MLNNNGPNISDGLNSVVCEQTLWLLSVKLTLEEILEIVQCLLKNSNRFEEKNSMFPIAYSEFERDRTLHTAVGNGTGTIKIPLQRTFMGTWKGVEMVRKTICPSPRLCAHVQ